MVLKYFLPTSSLRASCGAQNRRALLFVTDNFDRYANKTLLYCPPDTLGFVAQSRQASAYV